MYMLFYLYAGEIQYSNCLRLEIAPYLFFQMGENCKSRQSCCSVVPLPVKHRRQHMYVEILPSPLSVDEHKHSPARTCYSNIFCTLRRELQTDATHLNLMSSTPCCGLLTAKIPRLFNSLHRDERFTWTRMRRRPIISNTWYFLSTNSSRSVACDRSKRFLFR